MKDLFELRYHFAVVGLLVLIAVFANTITGETSRDAYRCDNGEVFTGSEIADQYRSTDGGLVVARTTRNGSWQYCRATKIN